MCMYIFLLTILNRERKLQCVKSSFVQIFFMILKKDNSNIKKRKKKEINNGHIFMQKRKFHMIKHETTLKWYCLKNHILNHLMGM